MAEPQPLRQGRKAGRLAWFRTGPAEGCGKSGIRKPSRVGRPCKTNVDESWPRTCPSVFGRATRWVDVGGRQVSAPAEPAAVDGTCLFSQPALGCEIGVAIRRNTNGMAVDHPGIGSRVRSGRKRKNASRIVISAAPAWLHTITMRPSNKEISKRILRASITTVLSNGKLSRTRVNLVLLDASMHLVRGCCHRGRRSCLGLRGPERRTRKYHLRRAERRPSEEDGPTNSHSSDRFYHHGIVSSATTQ